LQNVKRQANKNSHVWHHGWNISATEWLDDIQDWCGACVHDLHTETLLRYSSVDR